MKVVEKDRVVSGMLQDELDRCEEILSGLEKSVAGLPKGVLNKRIKKYKDRTYSYFHLKYREEGKVINKHVPAEEVMEVRKQIKERKKYEEEIRSYKKRIAYLNRLLKSGGKGSHGKKD